MRPALAVVAAAAVAVAGFFAGRMSGEDEDAPRRRLAVRAGEIANTLYNYDYRQVDQYLNRQASVMTKEMADQAGQSRDTISAIITGGKLVWTSRVTRVYVADMTATSASAIVELNGKVTNSKGISTLTGTVVRFQLARTRGTWLVSKAPETLTVGKESATDLNGKVTFRNLGYPEVDADYAARGGRKLPALWDGTTLHQGLAAVLAVLDGMSA